MSRLVCIGAATRAQFIGIERDDGTVTVASHYVTLLSEGAVHDIDGRRYRFVRPSTFDKELAAERLPPVWSVTGAFA